MQKGTIVYKLFGKRKYTNSSEHQLEVIAGPNETLSSGRYLATSDSVEPGRNRKSEMKTVLVITLAAVIVLIYLITVIRDELMNMSVAKYAILRN